MAGDLGIPSVVLVAAVLVAALLALIDGQILRRDLFETYVLGTS